MRVPESCKQPDSNLVPDYKARPSVDNQWQMAAAGSRWSETAAGVQPQIREPATQHVPLAVARRHCKWRKSVYNAYECQHSCMAAPPSPHERGSYNRNQGDLRMPLVLLIVPLQCMQCEVTSLHLAFTPCRLSPYANQLMQKTACMYTAILSERRVLSTDVCIAGKLESRGCTQQ